VNMTALRVSNLGRGFCVVGSRISQEAWVTNFAIWFWQNMAFFRAKSPFEQRWAVGCRAAGTLRLQP
jgi:hypothetical protein